MLKLIVIGTLLCASLNEARVMKATERTATVVREVKLTDSYSYTVPIDSHLYTVSTNFTHLLVNSTDENFKFCVIDFEDHSLQKKIRATVIDGKIIVWGIRAKYESKIGTRIDHTVLIVDPRQCSFKAVSTFEEERPNNWFDPGDNIARVVPYKDSFDVFYPSLQTCAPCRYTIDAKRIDLQHQLKAEVADKPIYFKIQSFSVPGLENGYLYAYRFGYSEESVIEVLDANWHVIKRKNLDHKIDVIAVSPAAHPGVSVCYMSAPSWDHKSNDTIYCENYDSDLKLRFSTRLPMLEGYVPDSLSVTADSQGDLFISTAQSLFQSQNDRRRFVNYQVNPIGVVTDISTVYQLPKDYYGVWDIHGFFSNNTYCAEYNNNDRFYSEDKQEYVKCVNIPTSS